MANKYKKRKDGRYCVQIQIGQYGEADGVRDGKPRFKSLYARTQPELEKKERDFRNNLEKGIIIDDKGLTVGQWSLKWLELYKSNVSYNTKRMYESSIKTYIIPSFGQYKLKDLRPHHVQQLINSLEAKGHNRTAEIVCLTLRQILETAIKNELIYRNVIDNISRKKAEKTVKRALSDYEIELIKSVDLPLREKAFVFLLLNTGLRRGEAFALMRGDISLIDRTITVSKSTITKQNRMEIKNSPKSLAGNRVLPITDELYPVIAEWLHENKSLYVFPTARGGLMTDTAFRYMWDKIIRALNLAAGGREGEFFVKKIADDITPHIFRHTYASLLHRAGVDIKTAQYLLGHSSLKMTMDIYTHLDNQKKEKEIDKFNQFMTSFSQSKVSQTKIQGS